MHVICTNETNLKFGQKLDLHFPNNRKDQCVARIELLINKTCVYEVQSYIELNNQSKYTYNVIYDFGVKLSHLRVHF